MNPAGKSSRSMSENSFLFPEIIYNKEQEKMWQRKENGYG